MRLHYYGTIVGRIAILVEYFVIDFALNYDDCGSRWCGYRGKKRTSMIVHTVNSSHLIDSADWCFFIRK